MAAPIPDNEMPRAFEAEYLENRGLITSAELTLIQADITSQLSLAGRDYVCPKCGGFGFHNASVDDSSIIPADDYRIRCTLGVVQPIYSADPTIKCLGWGYLTANLKYEITSNLVPA